jgi:squalene synthase HpnC
MARASGENFPVALRVLPRSARHDLMAIYGFARLADTLGDEYDGDRLDALDWLEADVEAAAAGHAQHPVCVRLTPTIERHHLDLQPFRDLIEANRIDQHRTRYATFDDLVGYCRLSADPVGRLVLAVFGAATSAAVALSDQVCSGLQVVEHLQDVAEDMAAGRIYLPLEDLARFGVREDDLASPAAGATVRRLVEHECGRARVLLDRGRSLPSSLPWWPRLAVAGFLAGGYAALDAIAAVDFDVLAHRAAPRKSRVLRHALGALRRRRP